MKKKNQNEFYDTIKSGLEDALALTRGNKVPVTIREVEIPDPPKPMTPREIAALRANKAHVSQAVFAKMINASVQTIHAWEQGRGRPSGPALRFLRLLQKRPELMRELRP